MRMNIHKPERPAVIERDTLVSHLHQMLEADRFKDYGPNGLQVEGKASIHKVVTGVTASLTLWLGYTVLKMPMGLLFGVLSGLQTNPAVLSFALEQTDNDLPNVGYATVYPVATIAKIVLAQLMLTLLH